MHNMWCFIAPLLLLLSSVPGSSSIPTNADDPAENSTSSISVPSLIPTNADDPAENSTSSISVPSLIPTIADDPAENSTSIISGSSSIPTIADDQEEYSSDDYSSDCEVRIFSMANVTMLKHGDVFVIPLNKTFNEDAYEVDDSKVQVCISKSSGSCSKNTYKSHEYEVLTNETVLVFEEILNLGRYMIIDHVLIVCDEDYDYTNSSFREAENRSEGYVVLTLIGQIGGSISVISLTAHLITFCVIPEMRNLPGYNMASLSLSFLLAYTFLLIGQIPQVLGTFCVFSAVVTQNFFLSAFSWMNVMAFDVWRTLRRATKQLVLSSVRMKMKFVLYSAYAWGLPLILSIAAVAADNSDSVSKDFKSGFGNHDYCIATNEKARTAFFTVPAFVLLVVNVVFFILSAYMVASNTMKTVGESQRTAKVNFVLYLRLALIMGLSWVVGVIAIFAPGKVLWYIFDAVNSTQGAFLFILFTCSRKTARQLKRRLSNKTSMTTTEKNTTSCSDTKSDHTNRISLQEKY